LLRRLGQPSRAEELFVFAGAGLSRSAPAGLPLFPWLRDEIMHQLDLGGYVATAPGLDLSEQQQAAAGLAPERFMLELQRNGAEPVAWLRSILSRGAPNAGHVALAQLAAKGAQVWTVNFDTLIEQAVKDGPLPTCAWPGEPSVEDHLLKPHGTLSGELIITAEQVLLPLAAKWEERLRNDVAGRTVVFVGYSGKDLDFQPLWADVLRDAREVLWFDLTDPVEQDRKRTLLRDLDAAGRLRFPHRSGPGSAENPTWTFVEWCRERRLVDIADASVATLLQAPAARELPLLPGRSHLVRAAIQQVLGDVAAARRTYARAVVTGPRRRRALNHLVHVGVNHGRGIVGAALAVGRLLPPVGQAREVRAVALRKRATILSNLGRHHAVLRETARSIPADVATLTLRAAAVRMTGSLDVAAGTAAEAMRLAQRQQHPVLLANAAFQRGLALIWAYRLDEARHHLERAQRPFAELASSRWMAWADFTEADLEIHRRQPGDAMRLLDAGAARFRAEALVDGQIDVAIVRLTALRLDGDEDGYQAQRRVLKSLLDTGGRRGVHYAKGSPHD
jgi:hypothetical protein